MKPDEMPQMAVFKVINQIDPTCKNSHKQALPSLRLRIMATTRQHQDGKWPRERL
jgi:hypothetical protein